MKRLLASSGPWWALGLLSALVATLQVSPVVNPPRWDECIVLYDAWRTVTGEVPYRDFFNFLPPGCFFFFGGLFRLEGSPGLASARWLMVLLVLLAAAAVLYALRRRGVPLCRAAPAAFLLPAGLFPFWGVPSHHWLAAVAWALFFLVLAAPREEAIPPWRWAAAGAVAGTGALVLQSDGLLMGVAGMVRVLLEREGRSRKVSSFAAGGLPPLLAAGLWLLLHGALGGFFRDALLWPLGHYSRPGSENYRALLEDLPGRLGLLGELALREGGPGRWTALLSGGLLYALLLLLALAIVAAAVAFPLKALGRRRMGDPWTAAASAATLASLALFARGNPNWLHLVFALWPLLLLWSFALAPGEKTTRGAPLLALLLLLSALLYHSRALAFHLPEAWEFTDPGRTLRESPVNVWLRTSAGLQPGDRIAAFPEGGEVYLFTRPAGIGFTYFTPLSAGYLDGKDHERAAARMESVRCSLVLLPVEMEAAYLDPASAVGRLLGGKYLREGTVAGAVVYRWKEPGGRPSP